MFAVLRSTGGRALANDTVAVLDRTGRQIASATFKPRSLPNLGDFGVILEPEATTAGGKVFYWDGDGVVRTLRPSGAVAEVAHYPLSDPQQELSVAVSPDGGRLMAALLTLPQPTRFPPGNAYFQAAPYQLDIYGGPVGGQQTVLRHQAGTINVFNATPGIMAMATWDSGGPVGIFPKILGTQGGGRHQYYGPLVRVGSDGVVGSPESSDPKCRPVDLRTDGYYVCVVDSPSPGSLKVIGPAGQVAWQRTASINQFAYPLLSADHTQVMAQDLGIEVLRQDGSTVALPTAFTPDGWVSKSLVAGGIQAPSPSQGSRSVLIDLSDPSKAIDFGPHALFAGALN